MALVKAKLKNLDTNQSVSFQFNPTDYSMTKSIGYSDAVATGGNVPRPEFTGGKGVTITLKLFFDTTKTGKDVRTEYTNKLWDLALVAPSAPDSATNKGQPPMCEFQWGAGPAFKAVVTSLTQNFLLFLENGTPVRTTVDISLKQAVDASIFPGQNPTSRGASGHRTHVVEQRETLDLIAAHEYGDAEAWRYIARVNNIDSPLKLRPGTVLALPPLERE
ncbi:MAG: peptidoglycan-binding protein [Anaerolineaceae bacterium]